MPARAPRARAVPRAVAAPPPRFATRAPDVTVTEVHTRADREAFVRFQHDLYAQEPNFVPPLVAERLDFVDPSRSPYLQHVRSAFFLARRRGQVVGRVAVVNDGRYNAFHDSDVGFFGLFESQNDAGLAAALLEAAANWLKATGPRTLVGPVNLAFHHDVGLLVEGFELPPSMMMPYNPRTYAQLLEANGFTRWKDLFSYELTQSASMPEKFVQIAERARKNFTLRRLDLGDADGEARRIREVYDAFVQPGWGLAPLSQAEMELTVQRLRPLVFLRPELSFVAEVNSEPVGFALTVPESNVALKAAGGFLSRFGLPIGAAKFLWSVRNVKRLRVLLFGIKPGFRRRGLDALLAWETFKTAQKYGYTSGELGWVKEDDSLMNRMIQSTGARRIKTYRLYQRAI